MFKEVLCILLDKLGYVPRAVLDEHHCRCCRNNSFFAPAMSKYYDNAIIARFDKLFYTGETSGSTIKFTKYSKVRKRHARKRKNKRS